MPEEKQRLGERRRTTAPQDDPVVQLREAPSFNCRVMRPDFAGCGEAEWQAPGFPQEFRTPLSVTYCADRRRSGAPSNTNPWGENSITISNRPHWKIRLVAAANLPT